MWVKVQTQGRCVPARPSQQLRWPPHSMNGDTEGLRGPEIHLTPSVALDQRQTPMPATVLRPPSGLLQASPGSHGPRETQEPETLAHQTTIAPLHTQSQPFIQQSPSAHSMPSTFLGTEDIAVSRADQIPALRELTTSEARVVNPFDRCETTAQRGYSLLTVTRGSGRARIRTTTSTKVQKAPSTDLNSEPNLGVG